MPSDATTKPATRVDPSRPTAHPMGSLINAESGRHYVFASADDSDHMNHQYYEMLGYRLERATKGGVRVSMGGRVKEGEPLEFWGHVLMSCTLERKAEIEEFGPDGQTGRRLQRTLQDKINRRGIADGIDPRVGRFVSETTPLEQRG